MKNLDCTGCDYTLLRYWSSDPYSTNSTGSSFCCFHVAMFCTTIQSCLGLCGNSVKPNFLSLPHLKVALTERKAEMVNPGSISLFHFAV